MTDRITTPLTRSTKIQVTKTLSAKQLARAALYPHYQLAREIVADNAIACSVDRMYRRRLADGKLFAAFVARVIDRRTARCGSGMFRTPALRRSVHTVQTAAALS